MSATPQYRAHSRFWDILERGILREIGYPILVVSLVMFVCAMALLSTNLSELRHSYARAERSNTALVQIAMVNTDILRVEMIIRGYALSGDPIYLRWKDMAFVRLQRRVDAFPSLFSGEPVQLAHVKQLRSLLDEHCAVFDRLAAMVTIDKAAVTAEIVDYGKKVKRRPIEQLLTAMRDDELKDLAGRQRLAEQRVTDAYHYAVGISGIALLLGALGFALIIHDRRMGRRGTL